MRVTVGTALLLLGGELNDGDRYLLCSDGLYKDLRDGEIGVGKEEIVQGPCPPLVTQVCAGLGRNPENHEPGFVPR